MTDRDDDEEVQDDESLRSIRAVWLSLPDEEPPQAGLAQLMAAARAKAEEMAKPSLWRRFVDVWKRPPVLALATVVVLIAGALVIGKRKDELQTRDEATESAPPVTSANPATPTPATDGDTRANEDRGGADTPGEPAPDFQGNARLEKQDKPAPEKRAKQAAPKSDKVERGQDAKTGLAAGTHKITTKGSMKPEPPAMPKPEQGSKATAQEEPMIEGGEALELALPQADSSTTKPGIVRMLEQCKTAATRGDCDAVRAIARRIQQSDLGFYRQNVAKDATINKCLTTAAE